MPPAPISSTSAPAAPTPIAAEPQSKPSSTLWTTGAGPGSMATWEQLPWSTGGSIAGRALAAGAATAAVASATAARRVIRLHDGLFEADADDALARR